MNHKLPSVIDLKGFQALVVGNVNSMCVRNLASAVAIIDRGIENFSDNRRLLASPKGFLVVRGGKVTNLTLSKDAKFYLYSKYRLYVVPEGVIIFNSIK